MVKIEVKNVGTDYVSTPTGRFLHANAAEIYFNGKAIPLPMIVPNQLELKYSHQAGFGGFDIQLFQYVEAIDFKTDFRSPSVRRLLTQNFKKLLTSYPNLLGDIFLQYREDYPIKQSHRSTFHEVQVDANSTFLSDIEVNREQSAEDFINQSLELRDEYPDHIIRPTLDIGMRTTGLFSQKVNLLIKNKFPSFNIRFRAIKKSFKNWIGLSEIIAGQNIWCNVEGTTRRWFGKKRISQLAILFNLGIHTVSHGNLKAYGGFKVQPFLLDTSTLLYNPAPPGVTYPVSRADDVFTHERHLTLARRHIINKDYFSYYTKSKSGTKQALYLLQLLS